MFFYIDILTYTNDDIYIIYYLKTKIWYLYNLLFKIGFF